MKPKTNHIQRGLAYCYLKDELVEVPGPHIQEVCLGEKCPYLTGSAQGEGIECLWDDGTGIPLSYEDPFVLQKLGEKMKTRSVSQA